MFIETYEHSQAQRQLTAAPERQKYTKTTHTTGLKSKQPKAPTSSGTKSNKFTPVMDSPP
jgi:hypothetical protein